jgi:metal-responsive CopG/Arc/MetJ family transcriptional regulator
MYERTPKRGATHRQRCRFIGAWVPVVLIDLIDRMAERENRDRSKILRIALEEKVARSLPKGSLDRL